MNDPCRVSHDELKNDRQTSTLEEIQREELIKSVTKELYLSYKEDYDFFLDALSEDEKEEFTKDLMNAVMHPKPDDDFLEVYYVSLKIIESKMKDTAKFLAEDKARDVWG